MSPKASETLPALKAIIEADTIHVTQNDLIALAISEREDELEKELDGLKEHMSAIQRHVSAVSEKIEDGIEKAGTAAAVCNLNRVTEVLTAKSVMKWKIVIPVTKFRESIDMANLPDSLVFQVTIQGSCSDGEARGETESFELPIKVNLSTKLQEASDELAVLQKEFAEKANRAAQISSDLRNVDRTARKAHAVMIRKAIEGSPELRKLVPQIEDSRKKK